MKAFFVSLLSRKFLLTAGTIITFIAMEQYDQAVVALLAYLGVNVAQKATAKTE